MKPRLYLETTIPSYLVARPSQDKELEAQGWRVASPGPREPQTASYALREEPPQQK